MGHAVDAAVYLVRSASFPIYSGRGKRTHMRVDRVHNVLRLGALISRAAPHLRARSSRPLSGSQAPADAEPEAARFQLPAATSRELRRVRAPRRGLSRGQRRRMTRSAGEARAAARRPPPQARRPWKLARTWALAQSYQCAPVAPPRSLDQVSGPSAEPVGQEAAAGPAAAASVRTHGNELL
eukprot:7391484-Prymnesium_polylepis.4